MSLEFIKMHYTALHKNLEAPKKCTMYRKKNIFLAFKHLDCLVFYLFLDSNRRFFSFKGSKSSFDAITIEL